MMLDFVESIMLTTPHFIALGIPIILLFPGAVAEKLVRSSTWVRSDFISGIELALAAVSAALMFLLNLSTGQSTVSLVLDNMAATSGFLALCFLFFYGSCQRTKAGKPGTAFRESKSFGLAS